MEDMPALNLEYGARVEVGAGAALHSWQGRRGIFTSGKHSYFSMLMNVDISVGALSSWRGVDLRILPARVEVGTRVRDCASVVEDGTEHHFEDWAIDMPWNARWCTEYSIKGGGSAS